VIIVLHFITDNTEKFGETDASEPTDSKGTFTCSLQRYINCTKLYFTLKFRSKPETFVRRISNNSLSSSCHGSGVTWQEIGRTCGSMCS